MNINVSVSLFAIIYNYLVRSIGGLEPPMPCYTFFFRHCNPATDPITVMGKTVCCAFRPDSNRIYASSCFFYRIKQSCRNPLRVQRRSSLRTQRQLLRGCLTPTRHLPTFRRRRAYAPACLSEAASANVLCLPEPPTFVGCGRGGRQTKDNNHNILPLPLSTLLPHGVEWICHVKIPKLKIKTKTMSELLTGHGSHVL